MSTTPPAKRRRSAPAWCRSVSESATTDSADHQRQPRAVDQAREHVAADIVGAEREALGAARLPDRRREEMVAELLDRANAARPRRRAPRPASSSTMTPSPTHGAAVLGEAAPEQPQRPGVGRGGGARRARPRRAPSAADPRVEEAVGEIDAEIDEDDQARRPAASRPAAPDSRGAGCSRSASGRCRARRRSSRSGSRRRAACRPAARSPSPPGSARCAAHARRRRAAASAPSRARCGCSPRPALPASPSASCAR